MGDKGAGEGGKVIREGSWERGVLYGLIKRYVYDGWMDDAFLGVISLT